MYALFLRDHAVSARIGIHDFEQTAPQRLIVNVSLAIRGEADGDDLSATTDYDFLRQTAARIVASGHIGLQETFCRQMLEACKARTDVAAALLSWACAEGLADRAVLELALAASCARADAAVVVLLLLEQLS